LKKLQLTGHLLLVEDARDVRQVITRLIEHAGVTVTACGTGEEGLSASETTPIDLAIIDLGLPGISGFETLKALREAGHVFPCLALSGDSSRANHALWLELDGQGFISKPVARRVLFDDLERWLAPMSEASPPTGTLQARFISSMIESSGALRRAVEERNDKQIIEIAHRMKGTCAAFKATEVASAAAHVLSCAEDDARDPARLASAYAEVAEAVGRLSAG